MKAITLEKAMIMLEDIDFKQVRAKYADLKIRAGNLELENEALKAEIAEIKQSAANPD